MMEKNNWLVRLHRLAMLGWLHWLFGNLYETIVLAPNVLWASSQVVALERTRDLFSISAPYYYFLPWSLLTILLTVWLWWMVRGKNRRSSHWIAAAAWTGVGAGIVTAFIITHYNLSLWVGSDTYPEEALRGLIRENTFVGLLRLVLEIVAFWATFQSYLGLLSQEKKS